MYEERQTHRIFCALQFFARISSKKRSPDLKACTRIFSYPQKAHEPTLKLSHFLAICHRFTNQNNKLFLF